MTMAGKPASGVSLNATISRPACASITHHGAIVWWLTGRDPVPQVLPAIGAEGRPITCAIDLTNCPESVRPSAATPGKNG